MARRLGFGPRLGQWEIWDELATALPQKVCHAPTCVFPNTDTPEGMWPYTYDTCDGGTYPNQTDKNGNPAAALTGGNNGGPLSFLPGQRVSACTCPESDHPGPNVGVGRGVPEIDIFEAQIDTVKRNGEISQSYQIAPYDIGYNYNNETPATTLYDTSSTFFNNYKGGVYQQALSAVTMIDNANYGGGGYGVYGFEWWSDPKHRDQGYITWTSGGAPTWTITSGSLGADSAAKISQRLISEEPHVCYIQRILFRIES